MLNVLLLVAFGYLLGSVPSGWLVMKVYRNQDLRKLGSGNIGAANVFRAGGVGCLGEVDAGHPGQAGVAAGGGGVEAGFSGRAA